MSRLLRIAKFAAYPLFYFFCLALFGYLTFPYDRVRDRVLAEVQKKAKPGERLEIEKLTSYWITGIEVRGVKLTSPPDDANAAISSMTGIAGMSAVAGHGDEGAGAAGGAPPKDKVITIDAAHARLRILPLLIGRLRVDFWASVFDGEIEGMAPVDGKGGDIEVSFHGIDLGKVGTIAQSLGIPFNGMAKGKLALSAPDGKFNKANGSFELSVADITVGDGKTKVAGMVELPVTKLGTLTMSAEAKEGVLKLVKFSTDGTDLELVGDGRISLKDPWDESAADLYMRFKFNDVYRGKNDITKMLLGDPASTSPGTIEMLVPKMKRAKRPDNFYGWHVYGPLKRIKFDPSVTDPTGTGVATPAAGLKTRPNIGKPEIKRPGGLGRPAGAERAAGEAPPPKPVFVDPPKPPDPPPPERDRRSPLEIERALERTGRGVPPSVAQPAPPPAHEPEPPPPQPAAAPQPEAQPAQPDPAAPPVDGVPPTDPPPADQPPPQ